MFFSLEQSALLPPETFQYFQRNDSKYEIAIQNKSQKNQFFQAARGIVSFFIDRTAIILIAQNLPFYSFIAATSKIVG
jgi:hypothetical protein